jgi:hypothetical protein
MKNNTKIRLKLTKQLFESLAKQVLAEGKSGNMSGGAYTEAVKVPKAGKSVEPKASKSEEEKSHKNESPMKKKKNHSLEELKAMKEKLEKKINEMEINVDEDDTMDFQSGAFDVSEMGKMKGKKDVKEALGRQVAAEDLMGAISNGDPFLTGVALVGAVVAGVLAADKVIPKVKGYIQGLKAQDPSKAEELKKAAENAGVDVDSQ